MNHSVNIVLTQFIYINQQIRSIIEVVLMTVMDILLVKIMLKVLIRKPVIKNY